MAWEPRRRSLVRALPLGLLACGAIALPPRLPAQGRSLAGGFQEAHHRSHLSHALLVESPTAHTQVRLEYGRKLGDGGGAMLAVEAEFAVSRTLGIALELPVTFGDVSADGSHGGGELEIGLKAVGRPFEHRRLWIGYGLALGIPVTGEDAGHPADEAHEGGGSSLELEPFVGVGQIWGSLEATGTARLSVPTAGGHAGGEETRLGYEFALLYHLGPRVETVIELAGETPAGLSPLEVRPGVLLAPGASSELRVGLGLSLPVISQRENSPRLHVVVLCPL